MSILRTIASGWFFSQVDGGTLEDREWIPVSAFPTTVHVELLKLKRIPDPVRVVQMSVWDGADIGSPSLLA
jgi:beta-mannosidase